MGTQIPTILTLGHPWGEMGAQKGVSKKGCKKQQKTKAFWGGPAAGGAALELKKSSKFAEEACLDLKDCTWCSGVLITLCSPYGGRRILRATPSAADPLAAGDQLAGRAATQFIEEADLVSKIDN